MPMTVPGMATVIEAQLVAATPITSQTEFALALAQAIVTYIQTNATVIPTMTAGPYPVLGTGHVT